MKTTIANKKFQSLTMIVSYNAVYNEYLLNNILFTVKLCYEQLSNSKMIITRLELQIGNSDRVHRDAIAESKHVCI
jgi:aspartate ammonia-lyase